MPQASNSNSLSSSRRRQVARSDRRTPLAFATRCAPTPPPPSARPKAGLRAPARRIGRGRRCDRFSPTTSLRYSFWVLVCPHIHSILARTRPGVSVAGRPRWCCRWSARRGASPCQPPRSLNRRRHPSSVCASAACASRRPLRRVRPVPRAPLKPAGAAARARGTQLAPSSVAACMVPIWDVCGGIRAVAGTGVAPACLAAARARRPCTAQRGLSAALFPQRRPRGAPARYPRVRSARGAGRERDGWLWHVTPGGAARVRGCGAANFTGQSTGGNLC